MNPKAEVPDDVSTYVNSLKAGGAKCGAFGETSGGIGPHLQSVINAWPALSLEECAKVLAIVEAATGKPHER